MHIHIHPKQFPGCVGPTVPVLDVRTPEIPDRLFDLGAIATDPAALAIVGEHRIGLVLVAHATGAPVNILGVTQLETTDSTKIADEDSYFRITTTPFAIDGRRILVTTMDTDGDITTSIVNGTAGREETV